MSYLQASASAAAAVVAWVVAVNITQTITLGSLMVGVLVGAAGLIQFGYGARWKAAAQVSSAQAEELRKALADERDRSDRIEKLLLVAKENITEQATIIERLSSLPNLEKLVTLMSDTAKHQDEAASERLGEGITKVEGAMRGLISEALAAHEERAQERHEGQIAVLAGIAANQERLLRGAQ